MTMERTANELRTRCMVVIAAENFCADIGIEVRTVLVAKVLPQRLDLGLGIVVAIGAVCTAVAFVRELGKPGFSQRVAEVRAGRCIGMVFDRYIVLKMHMIYLSGLR